MAFDQQTLESIALDVAAGMSEEAIVLSRGLVSRQSLRRILKKEGVCEMVQTYRQEIEIMKKVIQAKEVMAANQGLDQLISFMYGAELDDKEAIGVRKWLVDKQQPERGVVGEEVVAFAESTIARLCEVNRELVSRPVVQIEAGDRHLHVGSDFMEQRDMDLAQLGKGDFESE